MASNHGDHGASIPDEWFADKQFTREDLAAAFRQLESELSSPEMAAALNEADEVSQDDLEAASVLFDRLADRQAVKVNEQGVVYVEAGEAIPASFTDAVTCGTCGRTWDDAVITGITPAPSARCPFEYEHTIPGPFDESITKPVSIEGTVTLSDGVKVSFLIDAEYGWRKWGASNETLYLAGPVVEAMNEAAQEHLAEDE